MLYEDDALVALNKPAGLPTVPVKGSNIPSAWSLLEKGIEGRGVNAFSGRGQECQAEKNSCTSGSC